MKLFSQAIFQCHIPLCLIHEVGVSHWHHLSSSSGQGSYWALGRLMPQRNICQSGACGSWAAFPSSINQTKLMNLPLRLVLMPVQAWEHTGDGCMHACMLGKQCTLTVSHYCAITSVYLWHSGYPNKDFHMPVTDVFPVWTLLKTQLWANVGKQVS